MSQSVPPEDSFQSPFPTGVSGAKMETAGFEPAPSRLRRLDVANSTVPAILDADLEPGDWAWRLEKSNKGGAYVCRNVGEAHGRRRIYLHRWVLGLHPTDSRRVDHINGDPLDNRRANLRIVTTAQNAQNQGSRGGSSKYRGVTWDRTKSRWRAQGMLNGKCFFLGRYHSEDEAGAVAAEWRAKHMPYSEEARRAG